MYHFGSPTSSLFRLYPLDSRETTPLLDLSPEDVGQQCLGSRQSSSATGTLLDFGSFSPTDGNMLLP